MYHYTSVGLDNVWLQNGFSLHETPYGEGVAIEDAEGLHRMLAVRVANKAGPLSHKELRFLRTYLRLSQEGLGRMLGVDAQTVSLWERHRKLPVAAETVIRMLTIKSTDGLANVTEIIERINTAERLVNQRIVATERRRIWKSKMENHSEHGSPGVALPT